MYTQASHRTPHLSIVMDPRLVRFGLSASMATIASLGVVYGQTLALLPLLVLAWRHAHSSWVYLLAYQIFIFATFPDLASGLANQYQWSGPLLTGLAYGAVALWASLFALPGLICFAWRDHPTALRRFFAAAGAWLLLPAALAPVYVLHPVLAAGDWFPGDGWYGLLKMAAVLLILAMADTPKRLLCFAVAAGVVWLVTAMPNAHTPQSAIRGVDVRLGRPAVGLADRASQLQILGAAVERAMREGADVVITPELVVLQSDGSLNAWQNIANRLAERYRATIWTGAGILDNGELLNLTGSTDPSQAPVAALVPLPFVMWKPWRGLPSPWSDGPRWRKTPTGTHLGFLFCFESLTPAAWMERANQLPGHKVVAFISSQWWAASPRVGSVLDTSARSFAQLMAADYVSAVTR